MLYLFCGDLLVGVQVNLRRPSYGIMRPRTGRLIIRIASRMVRADDDGIGRVPIEEETIPFVLFTMVMWASAHFNEGNFRRFVKREQQR